LECPADPEARQLVGWQARDGASEQPYITAVRGVKACDQVEDRCFSRTVRADNAKGFTLHDAEGDAADGLDTAEAFL
jgi:hypothetical protein